MELAFWKSSFERQVKATVEQTLSLRSELSESEFQSICQEEFLQARPVSTLALAEEINAQPTSTWTAEVSERFLGASIKDATYLMGTIMGDKAVKLEQLQEETPLKGDLPASFDARTAFPECANVIGHIRDQSECGSCWAFSSTTSFNDRLCIASKGAFQTLLSPQHTASCCSFLKCISFGCSGGQPGMAWKWFKRDGVVTGGDFGHLGKGDTCWPYEIEPCSPGGVNGLTPCTGKKATPRCRKSCLEDKYPTAFKQDRQFATKSYSLKGRDQIKRNIMEKGSVSAAFFVYEDFVSYKSGIYQYTRGARLGGHAVKLIGWGQENGIDYWIIANSWGTRWGENGYFRMKMGDCGIDDMMVAGDVKYTPPKFGMTEIDM